MAAVLAMAIRALRWIDGNIVMDFTREAASEGKAIASALTDIKRAIKNWQPDWDRT